MPDPILAELLRRLAPTCGPVRLVAVDGPSGAGKSTLARRLAKALGGAPVVRSDEFPVPWDGDPLAWWPPLEEQVLRPLADGRPGRYRPYDWRAGTYGAPVEIPAAPVVIVEGVGAARAGAPVAFRIWVDAPYELRRERVLDRDGPEVAAQWDTWAAVEQAHFAADRTRDRADLRVDGTEG